MSIYEHGTAERTFRINIFTARTPSECVTVRRSVGVFFYVGGLKQGMLIKINVHMTHKTIPIAQSTRAIFLVGVCHVLLLHALYFVIAEVVGRNRARRSVICVVSTGTWIGMRMSGCQIYCIGGNMCAECELTKC